MRVRRSLVLLAAAAAALGLLGAAQGAFPGSNGLIAYSCNSTSVCTANPDGSNAHVLLSAGADPVWSPNAAKLAFARSGDVWTSNADGSNQQLFVSDGTEPSWSSDNATIAYTKSDNHIWIKSATSEQQVTSGTDSSPALSPNGLRLAYVEASGGHLHIYVLTLGSGSPTALTNGTGDETSPTWSPDGATVLYESNGSLYRVPSTGGSPTQVGSSTDAHDPAYSPDGTKIVYATGAGGLVVEDAAGTNGNLIVNAFANAQAPDWGSAPASSAPPPSSPSDTVNGPDNTSYPVITLTRGDSAPIVGHLLTASVGTWTGTFPISYSYQWKRCDGADPVNGSCFDIPDATSSAYTPVPADNGLRIRVAVSATNTDGRHTQNSEVTAPVVALAPKNTATPPITPGGTNSVDQTLTVATGTWTGSTPIAYTYSWRRCNPAGDFASCIPVVGATAASYVPTVADIGFTLRVWITGANIAGSDTTITNHTFPIIDKQHFSPSATLVPSIAGVALPGRQLTADVGVYKGDAPMTTSFRWFRCDAVGDECHAIRGGTTVVYHPTSADIGYTLRLFVSVSNAYGKLLSKSDPTDTVAATPPHVRGRHIVGTARGNYLAGGGHDDTILGLGGNDTLLGGAGDDLLTGGRGNDVISGGAGADRLFGGPGSDTINAVDGERDVIDCGTGSDHATVDPVDITRGCEVVTTQQ